MKEYKIMDKLNLILTGLAIILFSIAFHVGVAFDVFTLIFSAIGLVVVLIGCFKK